MQTQSSKSVDWAALDEYLMNGAESPGLARIPVETLIADARDTRVEKNVHPSLPLFVEPETLRWAGMPF